MRTIKKVLTLTAMAAALQACGGGNEIGPELVAEPSTAAASTAVFDPSLGGDGLPFPVDLLFASTADGSINIPGKVSSFDPTNPATLANAVATPPPAALADPQTALNTMDGFSTTAPMVVRFSDDIDDPADPDDIKENVRIFRLTTADPGASNALNVDAELVYGVDFAVGVSSGTTMLIQPLKPLEPGRTHVVVIENGLKTTGGNPVSADSTYSLLNGAYQLEGAVGFVGGESDFVLEDDGDPCDFNDGASVLVCTDVNTEDYTAAAAVPGAESAAVIAGNLQALETAGSYTTLYQLEQLRRITSKHLAATGVTAADVALSYSVTTENIQGALMQAKGQVDAAGTQPSITVLNQLAGWAGNPAIRVTSPGPDGDTSTTDDYLAHIYVATLDDVIQFVDPASPNTSVWEADNSSWIGGVVPACAALPAHALGGTKNLVGCNQYTPFPKVADHTVPVLISAPRSEALAGGGGGLPDCSPTEYPDGLPVVIYQHGITANRGSLMAIADTLASQCTVGVAIDLPKHGILPSGDRFSGLFTLQATLSGTKQGERLVQVADPVTQCQAGAGVAVDDTGAETTDSYCPSGDNFINLTNLANARDSLRQAVVDLHSLKAALAGAGLNATSIGATIDTAEISFVGTSLGAMVGTPFVAHQGLDLVSAVLNNPGGGIAKVLDGSPTIEPQITAGLSAAAGIVKPGGDYEGFLIIAQAMVDNVDPINYATQAAGTTLPLLVQQVIGDPSNPIGCEATGEGCPDQVVPNNVFMNGFGPAWGLVAQTGQYTYLANQTFATVPVALAGTDPLTQGTGFIVGGTVANSMPSLAGDVIGAGPLGGDSVMAAVNAVAPDTFPAGATTFKGLGLPLVTECGAAGTSGVVRFTSGDHGSLLSPEADPAVTAVMQKQMITFARSGGGMIANDEIDVTGDGVVDVSAGVVFTPGIPSASTAACAP